MPRIRQRAVSGDAQSVLLLKRWLERLFGARLPESLRSLRAAGHVRGQRLDAQAAIHIRSKQGADPAQVFVATLHAVFAAPKRDDGDEAGFVVGDHHEATREAGDFTERTVNG